MTARSLHIGPRIGPRIGVQGDDTGSPPATTTLTVTIDDTLDPVITAVNYNYTVVVTNTGAISATNVSAVVGLDASLTFVSGSGTGWTVGAVGQIVTCTRATLAVGAAPTITITVTSGASAVTASTTANANADNASAPATQDTETTAVKLVVKDAASGWRFPASATQWSDFNAYHVAIGTSNYPNVSPNSTHLCQEASGNLADSIGSVTLTQSGAGHLYQQPVSGFTRLAATTVDGTAAQKWLNTTVAPNPNTVSTGWLQCLRFPAVAPAATRDVVANSGSMDFRFTNGGKVQIINGATTAGTSNPLGTVQWTYLQHDLTNSLWRLFTLQEVVNGTFAAVASNPSYMLGGQTTTAGDFGYMHCNLFGGAPAELSTAQVRALLGALTRDAVVPVVIPW